ncbi:MAG: ABC transporter ATP-binding protein [Leeuwenhoekiella sp.]
MSEIILKAENISKQYRLGVVSTGALSHDLKRWWYLSRGKEDPFLKIGAVNKRDSKVSSDYIWALKNINFEVKTGEVLGIIGKNGAGKSTLLKILSRVTSPTTGSIKTRGRIASLLEVGTGFHPELTGRENIYLNGAILGMSKAEINSKFDEIVDFSGCEMYIDTPTKRYSSGMTVRLAFAVAAHLEPEILVVDEVLAVGDAEFQKKAIGKMQDITQGEGRTVLFVSHNMSAVRDLCTRGIVLHNGSSVFEGNQNEAVDRYLMSEEGNLYFYKTNQQNIRSNFIDAVVVQTSHGNGIHYFAEELTIEITLTINHTIKDPAVSYHILDASDKSLVHELILNKEQEFAQKPGKYILKSKIENPKLYQGKYKLNVHFADNFTKIKYSTLLDICHFEIINPSKRDYYWGTGSAVYKEDTTSWDVKKKTDVK